MNTELLHKLLDVAREAATGAAAMEIEDLQRDLALVPDDLDELAKIAAFDKIKAHIDVQPFDTVDNDDGTTSIEGELTEGAFAYWLGELERLAQ